MLIGFLLRTAGTHFDVLQSFENLSENFQFTFSAPIVKSFMEPKTPPQNRLPSFECVETPTSPMSQSSTPPGQTPPATDYSSSYYQLDPEEESEPDSLSALSSPTPCPKKLLLWSSPTPSFTEVTQSIALSSARPPSVATSSGHSNASARKFFGAEAATVKRTFAEIRTSTPPVSPEKKKKRVSAIRTALQESPKGLMKFLKKCTATERNDQLRRATEEENEQHQEREGHVAEIKARQREEAREGARIRQQKHRQHIYKRERLRLVRGLLGEQSIFRRLAKAMHIDPKLCH
jgi:hypothetical protein